MKMEMPGSQSLIQTSSSYIKTAKLQSDLECLKKSRRKSSGKIRSVQISGPIFFKLHEESKLFNPKYSKFTTTSLQSV